MNNSESCDHCWRDLGLNLAECTRCGIVIMHDMNHWEFDQQDCRQAVTEPSFDADGFPVQEEFEGPLPGPEDDDYPDGWGDN